MSAWLALRKNAVCGLPAMRARNRGRRLRQGRPTRCAVAHTKLALFAAPRASASGLEARRNTGTGWKPIPHCLGKTCRCRSSGVGMVPEPSRSHRPTQHRPRPTQRPLPADPSSRKQTRQFGSLTSSVPSPSSSINAIIPGDKESRLCPKNTILRTFRLTARTCFSTLLSSPVDSLTTSISISRVNVSPSRMPSSGPSKQYPPITATWPLTTATQIFTMI